MSLLKTTANITALLGAELFGRILLGVGLFGIFFGGILGYIITGLILGLFEVESNTKTIASTIVSIIIFFVSVAAVVLGILMLVWAKNKKI